MLRLSRSSKIALGFIVAVILAFLYIPLMLVVLNSFNSARIASWPVSGFSLEWWGKAFTSQPVRDALLNSVLVATGATVIALILGTLVSFALQRYRFFGQRAVNLLVVLPIALVAMFIGWRWLANVGETMHAPIDVLSIVLSAFGFGGLVYGLSQIGSLSSGANPVPLVISLVVGAIGLGLFLWRQVVLQRKDDALLDLRIFLSKDFSLAMGQMFLLSLAFFGSITIIPLFLQDALQLNATDAGLIVLPGALAMGLLGPVIGRIYDSRGTRVLLVPGSILAASMLWVFTTVNTGTPVWLVLTAQTLLSVGLALSFTPLFTAALASLKPKFYSYGSAVIGTIQQVSGAAGFAVMMTVFTAVVAAGGGTEVPTAVASGTRTALVIGAIIATVTIVGAFLIRKPEDDSEEAPAHAGH